MLNDFLQVRGDDANMRCEDAQGVRVLLLCMSMVFHFNWRWYHLLCLQLLALLGIGFLQGLYALDAADGNTDHPVQVRLLGALMFA